MEEHGSEPKPLRISDIVSPDAPTTTNERGGSQSDIRVRFDLIDAKALFEMAKVLDHGARKYGEDNWRLIPVEEHLNHGLMHIYAYLAGDRTDEHLSHFLCRATFALGVSLQGEDYQPDTVTHHMGDGSEIPDKERGIAAEYTKLRDPNFKETIST